MTHMVVDLDTGTVVGTNLVVVEAFDVDYLNDSQIVEYANAYGTPIEGLA